MHRIGSNDRPDLPLALIIGAGGMGMAVARRLGLSQRLLIADRNVAHLETQYARLTEEGHDVSICACDVTNTADVENLARRAAATGPLRTLVYVVGLSPSMGDFDAIMRVNLIGAARMAEAVGQVIAPGGAGIFISSSAAHMNTASEEIMTMLDTPLETDLLARLQSLLGPGATSPIAYALSKAALLRLCARLARQWGERGARILSLSPGLIATPMGAAEFERSAGKRSLFEAIPLKREGTMIEIANVVDFLASDAASFISGTDILVDGGMMGTLRK